MPKGKQIPALQKLFAKQAMLMYISIFLSLVAMMLWIYIPYKMQTFPWFVFLLILLGIVVLAAIPFWYDDFKHKQNNRLLQQLNSFPQMEYSTQLLLKKPQQMNPLEKIQQNKISAQLETVLKQVYPHHFLGKAFLCFCMNLILVLGVLQFQLKPIPLKTAIQTNEAEASIQKPVKETILPNAQLQNYKLHISPPSYTGLSSSTQKKLTTNIPEGSHLRWQLNFDRLAPTPFLEINGKLISFKTQDSISYKLKYKPEQKMLYSLQMDTTIKSEIFNKLHTINIIPDKKPLVRITNLENYQQVDQADIKPQNIQFIANDDYGITKGELQLIKSSGDGESVQFDQKNYSLTNIKNKEKQSLTINLNDLNPEPGDEFFIRMEVSDNHPTKEQISFSDTYIIAVNDTTIQQATFTMALGMDREPEYFRSQRQLIIDTEALLEQKSELSSLSFKEESNNIGIEQKLLRLRYGKFLGEEFEGQIGVRHSNEDIKSKEILSLVEEVHDHKKTEIENEEAHQHHSNCEHEHEHSHDEQEEEHDHDEHEGHDHKEHQRKEDDTHNGHHHEHNHNHDHSHGNESENPEEPKNWLAPFSHFHDNAESNTFFESEVKSKLKAALAQMWDAELQLRIGKPTLSLPYQHKALKLIKEVQQASRVYVERVGLELPEIDVAKKRLSGDLDEITNLENSYKSQPNQLFQSVNLALKSIDDLKFEQNNTEEYNQKLATIKQELNGLRYADENCYVLCMHTLQQAILDNRKLQELQFILNTFLKENETLNGKTIRKNSSLEDLYWQYVN